MSVIRFESATAAKAYSSIPSFVTAAIYEGGDENRRLLFEAVPYGSGTVILAYDEDGLVRVEFGPTDDNASLQAHFTMLESKAER